MNAISVRLPEHLNAALSDVSRKRGLSKSTVLREALERSMVAQGAMASPAERWVEAWQGRLKLRRTDSVESIDPRLAHLLAKHAR